MTSGIHIPLDVLPITSVRLASGGMPFDGVDSPRYPKNLHQPNQNAKHRLQGVRREPSNFFPIAHIPLRERGREVARYGERCKT